MGLDMFLEKRNKRNIPALDKNGCEHYIWDEVAYWRKANQIHQWFIDYYNLPGDFNCERQEVSKECLEELVDTCRFVLNNRYEPNAEEIAEENLPTQDGFFFGGTDYDEYYYMGLEDTITQLEKVIEETDWDNEIVCYNCWW